MLAVGKIPYDSLKEEVISFNETNQMVVVDLLNTSDWNQEKTGLKTYILNKEVENDYDNSKFFRIENDFFDLYKKIINDIRTIVIFERENFINKHLSIFNGIHPLKKRIYRCYRILKEERPDIVLFQSTPHHIWFWVFAMTAEYLQVTVNIVQQTPLPWRFWLVKGVDEQIVCNMNYKKCNIPDSSLLESEQQLIKKFISQNNGSYLDCP